MSNDASLDRDEFPDARARLMRGDDDLLKELLLFLTRRAAEFRKKYPLSRTDVDDVAAIALSRIWLNRRTFDPEKGTLAQWGYVILRRSAIDFLRAQRSQLPAGELADIPQSLSSVPGQPTRASDAVVALQQIMQSLSPTDRKILNAYATNKGGRWAADLAPELRLSAGAVRVRRYRLTQKIKAEMLRRGHGYLSSDEIADASR